jgi:hypothetical protein
MTGASPAFAEVGNPTILARAARALFAGVRGTAQHQGLNNAGSF